MAITSRPLNGVAVNAKHRDAASIELVAALASTSTISGAIQLPKKLDTNLSSAPSAIASLTTAIKLGATCQATPTISRASLSARPLFSGQIVCNPVASASLSSRIRLRGSAASSATTEAHLSTGIPLAASVSATCRLRAKVTYAADAHLYDTVFVWHRSPLQLTVFNQ